MTPTIFLTYPQKSSATFYPLPACRVFAPAGFYVYPCFISFAVYLLHITTGCVAIHDLALLLLAVKLLYHQFSAVVSPFHARYIVLLRIAGYIHFGRSAVCHVHHIDITKRRAHTN